MNTKPIGDARRSGAGERRLQKSITNFAVRGDGDHVAVNCRVSGDFKGSPVDLVNSFLLVGDKIAKLEIS